MKMTTQETRAVASLSLIMALRMLGLFMVIPLFTLYAHQLKGATPLLIGLAIGVYGLSQALLQIPFGWLSDHLGRKPILLFGLLLFILGSLVASQSQSIGFMIIGRTLQGAGAIGSTLLAAIADLTREDHRTKSMAIAGMTIGFSFLLAMLLGPILSKWTTVSELFLLASLFGIIAIFLLYFMVPPIHHSKWHRDTEPEFTSFLKLLIAPKLMLLNAGIFLLHAIFTASFVAIPIDLFHEGHIPTNDQWHLYLPALIIAFVLSLTGIGIAESRRKLKQFFIAGIFLLLVSECMFWLMMPEALLSMIALGVFFTGFSLLEAFLPSLISRTAPAFRRGSALGIYSSAQFLGIFAGGLIGGWIYGRFSSSGVYLFCMVLALVWLLLSSRMQTPPHLVTQVLSVGQVERQNILASLHLIPGVVEITLMEEEDRIYLKVERSTLTHPEFVRLKERLESQTS